MRLRSFWFKRFSNNDSTHPRTGGATPVTYPKHGPGVMSYEHRPTTRLPWQFWHYKWWCAPLGGSVNGIAQAKRIETRMIRTPVTERPNKLRRTFYQQTDWRRSPHGTA